ncbi:hypothetical protein ARALYDRAFT_916572 [Arabidopsis lyrata subsp. lyrata]|uniref:Dienelactone hydrolase domain-containing protein n=1 Tax=Arabidopsis lyrata subsp. lyrata TaxID=81972 RepID=D7MK60_ARALL|nr:hypothetical protein ARALYDRAFT_916572 [Arabidopsis lyrata subsp. lyrata]
MAVGIFWGSCKAVPTKSKEISLLNGMYYRPTVQQRKQAVFHLLGIPLASKPEMNSYVKIHPKVSHGWTVRYSIDDPEAVKAAEEAHKEMLDWFVT